MRTFTSEVHTAIETLIGLRERISQAETDLEEALAALGTDNPKLATWRVEDALRQLQKKSLLA